MPDVSRSDSQRSDTSLRPRVSFNRDVHVKRIVSRDDPEVSNIPNGEATAPLFARRKHLAAGHKDKQPSVHLHDVDRIPEKLPGKFNSLPTRKKHRKGSTESVNVVQQNHEENPGKLTRTQKEKGSLFNLFKRSSEKTPDKSKLKRSVSDASGLKSRTTGRRSSSDSIDSGKQNFVTKKNQLSPIIEVSTPRDDYFSDANLFNTKSKQLKEKWKSNDKEIAKSGKNGNKLDKNKANDKNKENKANSAPSVKDAPKKKGVRSLFRKESKKSKEQPKRDLKTEKKNLKNSINNNIIQEKRRDSVKSVISNHSEGDRNIIQERIKSFEKLNDGSDNMIHCSQQPPEKIPLTRGNNVDKMVKRLNNNKNSLPRMTSNVLITPSENVGHNNNQPFSYTQPRTETELADPNADVFNAPSSPVVYAKIVSGAENTEVNGKHKQTVQTFYKSRRKYFPHSDSDEGLGYEENSFNVNTHHERKENKHDSSTYLDEFPITPRYKYIPTNFGDSEYETDPVNLDSSARGQADGMDSKRRESLTEPHTINDHDGMFVTNGRSNLSYRRDLLESRINSRRLGEKNSTLNRSSPEILHRVNSPVVSRTVTEIRSSSRRHGSTSPVQLRSRNISESETERHVKESRIIHTDSRQLFEYERIYDCANEVYDSKPATVPISYHPSENINNAFNKYKQKSEKSTMSKDRDYYKSTPDIHSDAYDVPYKNDHHFVSETYHDSLRRHKHNGTAEETSKSKKKYFMHSRDGKDKYGDSGIVNDINRSPGENGKSPQPYQHRSSNESEDEGFASSLLIASEKQHTEENFDTVNGHPRKGYDSDKEARMHNKELHHQQHETLFKRKDGNKNKHEYVHRERSIDDGSHYDPRIDKNLEGKRETLKPVDKKPPKMSSLEKMKKLFSRDSSKKNKTATVDRPEMVREEYLRARYKEYRGNSPAIDKHSSKSREYLDRMDEKNSSRNREYLERMNDKNSRRSREYLDRMDEKRAREPVDEKHGKNRDYPERDDRHKSREHLDREDKSKSREYLDKEDRNTACSREYLNREDRNTARSREHLDKEDKNTIRSREYVDREDKHGNRSREFLERGTDRPDFARTREYLERDDKSRSREYLDKEDKHFSKSREYLDEKHSKSREYLNKMDEHHSESRHHNYDNSQPLDYSSRRRVSTPSPSPPRQVNKHMEKVKEKPTHEGWFKSLDRFSLKKNKTEKPPKETVKDDTLKEAHPPPTKSLRFFGDTDTETNDSVRRKSSVRSRTDAQTFSTSTPARARSQSTRNLHNISEEFDNSTDSLQNNNTYRSVQNIPESDMDMKSKQRSVAKSPVVAQRDKKNTLKMKNDRKKRNEASSADSSVEGDSSQQSQRSVVYLHAATVGDIPGPHYLSKSGRRMEPTATMSKKTLSRSFSVLVPWKLRSPNEDSEIDYSSSTMKSARSGRRDAKTSTKDQSATKNGYTLKRKTKSKEALSHTLSRKSEDNGTRSTSSTLYKKREKQPNENNRYAKDDKKMSKKSMSVESLGHDKHSLKRRKDPKVISRSVSLPRDTEKSAGWFGTSKKR
ncbi:uncharacterized protein CBL_08317 [Carabus blaptoides fortunei]